MFIGFLMGVIITAAGFIFMPLNRNTTSIAAVTSDDTVALVQSPKIVINDTVKIPATNIFTKKSTVVTRDSIVSFAKTLLGTPYLYGSTDPSKGFDCSGFITYVYSHFKIPVPRSSYDFGNIGVKKDLSNCKKGDLILFTGTNPEERTIGHIGIIIDTLPQPTFIHSSSGKAMGVTITSMDNVFYQNRFVSVVDILSK